MGPRSGYQGYGRGDGFGQPATDSEQLRQFAYAYEDQQRWRRRDPLAAPDAPPELRSPAWVSAGLGLVIFVVLLALAIGVGMLLNSPR